MTTEAQEKAGSPLSRFPWLHPIGFTIYPVLALYAANVDEVSLSAMLRPLIILAVATALLIGALYLFTRRTQSLCFVISLALLLFCVAWGPLCRPLLFSLGSMLGLGVRYLFVLFVLLICCLLAFLLWKDAAGPTLTGLANVAALALVIMASVNAAIAWGHQAGAENTVSIPLPTISIPADQARPDVYFIVLDGYGRADVLQEIFGLDNRPFLEALQRRGFFVAEASETSYAWTNQSLPACLNMTYLERLYVKHPETKTLNPRLLYRNSVVFRLFKRLGYHLRAVETGDPLTDPGPECDSVIRYDPKGATLNSFELMLLNMTPLSRVFRVLGLNPGHRHWRNRLLYLMEALPNPTPEAEGKPVLTVAHFICPHRPFVFAADGGPALSQNSFSLTARPGLDPPFEVMAKQYADQVQGLNTHVLAMIDAILATSEIDPVIALVSDHGPPLQSLYGEGRLKNLIVLRLPESNNISLSPTINLVEVFPTLLNTLFQAEIPMPLKNNTPCLPQE